MLVALTFEECRLEEQTVEKSQGSEQELIEGTLWWNDVS